MKTQQLYDEITSRGYQAEIVSMFSYDIDKDRRFKQLLILSRPTVELFSIVDKHDAHMRVDVLRKDGEASIVFGVYPNDPANFDWE